MLLRTRPLFFVYLNFITRSFSSVFLPRSAVAAEFVGMILFLYIICSAVVGTFNPVSGGAKAQITDVALAAGLTIAALVHTIGHISGG